MYFIDAALKTGRLFSDLFCSCCFFDTFIFLSQLCDSPKGCLFKQRQDRARIPPSRIRLRDRDRCRRPEGHDACPRKSLIPASPTMQLEPAGPPQTRVVLMGRRPAARVAGSSQVYRRLGVRHRCDTFDFRHRGVSAVAGDTGGMRCTRHAARRADVLDFAARNSKPDSRPMVPPLCIS